MTKKTALAPFNLAHPAYLPIFVHLSNISSNGVTFFHEYPSLSSCQVLSSPIYPANENAPSQK